VQLTLPNWTVLTESCFAFLLLLPLLLLPPGHKAWAFGLGLERLAMVLFDIPDIRCVHGRARHQAASGRKTPNLARVAP
jgi:hypothetical protein